MVVYNNVKVFDKCFMKGAVSKDSVVSVHNFNGVGLPTVFNGVIADYLDVDCWLVFCHQDFIFNCNLAEKLKGLNINGVYGPIGVRKDGHFYGTITQTNGVNIGKPIRKACPVQTLDEMCLIVHSRLLRLGLRFDERFGFHFYGADFCLSAFQNGFGVYALPIDCVHKSRNLTGEVASADFQRCKKLFRDKWLGFLPVATTACKITEA